MSKYVVAFSVDAVVRVTVNAKNEDEAKDKAWDNVQNPSLCWQCGEGLDLGEIMAVLDVEEV